jgi:hypothetical protein
MMVKMCRTTQLLKICVIFILISLICVLEDALIGPLVVVNMCRFRF